MPSTPPDDRSSVHQPHDGFFKSIFRHRAHAAAALRTILPGRVSRHIDWNSLKAVKSSFVDESLHQRHGDLMFSARLVGGHEARLWLLFEHQSTIDHWMALRMLEMAVEFLKGWREEHSKAQYLPVILPIVLYQGTTRWSAPRTLAELYDLSDQAQPRRGARTRAAPRLRQQQPSALRDLKQFLLSLQFVLGDLSVTPDNKLMKGPVDDLVRVALVVMKHVKSEHLLGLLARLHEEIERLLATERRRELSRVLWYIVCVHPKITLSAIIDRLTPLVGPKIAKAMESYDKKLERMLKEKNTRLAREEGQQEGQQKSLLQLLEKRFGKLPKSVTARVMAAGREDLERWIDRILDAKTLDEVFAEP